MTIPAVLPDPHLGIEGPAFFILSHGDVPICCIRFSLWSGCRRLERVLLFDEPPVDLHGIGHSLREPDPEPDIFPLLRHDLFDPTECIRITLEAREDARTVHHRDHRFGHDLDAPAI